MGQVTKIPLVMVLSRNRGNQNCVEVARVPDLSDHLQHKLQPPVDSQCNVTLQLDHLLLRLQAQCGLHTSEVVWEAGKCLERMVVLKLRQ